MSGVPRSQRLIGFVSVAQNDGRTWVCPANTVTLVKAAHFFNAHTTAGRAFLAIQLPTGGTNLNLIDLQLESNTAAKFADWFVLNPDDRITVLLGEANMIAWVSGAVLTGAPQFAPADRLLPRIEPHG